MLETSRSEPFSRNRPWPSYLFITAFSEQSCRSGVGKLKALPLHQSETFTTDFRALASPCPRPASLPFSQVQKLPGLPSSNDLVWIFVEQERDPIATEDLKSSTQRNSARWGVKANRRRRCQSETTLGSSCGMAQARGVCPSFLNHTYVRLHPRQASADSRSGPRFLHLDDLQSCKSRTSRWKTAPCRVSATRYLQPCTSRICYKCQLMAAPSTRAHSTHESPRHLKEPSLLLLVHGQPITDTGARKPQFCAWGRNSKSRDVRILGVSGQSTCPARPARDCYTEQSSSFVLVDWSTALYESNWSFEYLFKQVLLPIMSSERQTAKSTAHTQRRYAGLSEKARMLNAELLCSLTLVRWVAVCGHKTWDVALAV